MQRLFLLFLAVLAMATPVVALDNGLGKTPGMGWNSDYCSGCSNRNGFQNEQFIHDIADYLHETGLQKLGYHYVNMDASWNTAERDRDGNLIPDPALWPSGINATVNYVHNLGLGFGLYGDRGTRDCAKNPGALAHEQKDADFFAALEIDWYKEDSCYASGDHTVAFQEYGTMRDALNKTGRPIWFALCGWYPWYAPVGHTLGNSWRTGPDTGSGWTAVLQNVINVISVRKDAGPSANGGGWNDQSLLLKPGDGGKTPEDTITFDRHRSQFSLYCIMASNLLMTGNLSSFAEDNPKVLDTWASPGAIAINQDSAGLPFSVWNNGSRFRSGAISGTSAGENALPAAHVAECGGEPELQAWNIGAEVPKDGFIYNDASKTCLNVDDCKVDVIYDGCDTNKSTCAGPGLFSNEQWQYDSASNRLTSDLPGSLCLTVNADATLSISTCSGSDDQIWIYNNTTLQLMTKDGRCMTAHSQSLIDTLILTRPLANGDYALLLLNNKPVQAVVACDSDCLVSMGFSVETTVAIDVYNNTAVPVTNSGIQGQVGPNGASLLYRLSKREPSP